MTVKGLKALERKFATLRKEVVPSLHKEAVPKSAEMIASEAVHRAPVDEGELRDGISFEEGERTRTSASAMAVSRAEHSGPVEFGTSDTPAQPFMRPSRDRNRQPIAKQLGQWMRSFLKKFGRR